MLAVERVPASKRELFDAVLFPEEWGETMLDADDLEQQVAALGGEAAI